MIIRRSAVLVGLDRGWLVDVIFWATVAAMVMAGAFLMRHDFSSCEPLHEICRSD